MFAATLSHAQTGVVKNGAPVAANASATTSTPVTADLDLIQAVRLRDKDAVMRQLAAGTKTEVRDAQGRTPLYLAVATGQTDLVTLLLDKGADINARVLGRLGEVSPETGLTSLDKACRSEDVDMLLLLIGRGADMTYPVNNEAGVRRMAESLLGSAALWRNRPLFDALLQHGADAKTPGVLEHAISGGDLDMVRLLLEAGAPVKGAKREPWDEEITFVPLATAATNFGSRALVSLLLDKGADPAARAGQARTALSNALSVDDAETVMLLADKGAPLNLDLDQSPRTESPLQTAMRNGNLPLTQYLIAHGAFYRPKEFAEAALLNAVTRGDLASVKALCASPARVTEAQSARNIEIYGATPLHIAAFLGHRDIAGVLLAAGFAPDVRIRGGQTPLHWAALSGDTAMTQLLLDKGADVSACDGIGQTPLHLAAFNGSQALVALLLSKKADPNAALSTGVSGLGGNYEKGTTALHRAAYYGNQGAVKALLAAGVQMDAANERGQTPLGAACQSGSAATARLLLDAGDSLDAPLKARSPLWYAVQNMGAPPFHAGPSWSHPLPSPRAASQDAAFAATVPRAAQTTVAASAQTTKATSPLKGTLSTKTAQAKVAAAPRTGKPFDRAEVVALLLSRGAKKQVMGEEGVALLLDAVRMPVPGSMDFDGERGLSPHTRRVLSEQASTQARIVELLLGAGAPPNGPFTHKVQMYESDPNFYDSYDTIYLANPSPLHFAVLSGNPALVKALLDKNADPNAEDGRGRTPLDWLIRRGESSSLRADFPFASDVLMRRGDERVAPPDLSDPTPRRAIAALLRAKGARSGSGPLFFALYNKAENQVRTLLKEAPQLAHAHIYEKYIGKGSVGYSVAADAQYNSTTPLQVAVRSHQDELAQLLLASLAPSKTVPTGSTAPAKVPAPSTPANPDADRALLTAIGAKNWKLADSLLAIGANINALDANGMTLLHRAARQNDVETIEGLLQRGADINLWDADAMTPLGAARMEGKNAQSAADLLEKRGGRADFSIGTLLYSKQYDRILQAFQNNPAYAKFETREGDTILNLVARAHHPELVAALLKQGADPNRPNHDNMTPLNFAVIARDAATVTTLIEKGADPNFEPGYGTWYTVDGQRKRDLYHPVLYTAILLDDAPMVTLLLKHGARLDVKSADGMTPLDYALANKKDDMVKLLREAGA